MLSEKQEEGAERWKTLDIQQVASQFHSGDFTPDRISRFAAPRTPERISHDDVRNVLESFEE